MLKEKGNEVMRNVEEAWNAIEPRVLAEEGEMERRLARRKGVLFRSPLRAYCVAIRASDRRINDMWAVIVPRTAISLEADAHPGRYAEHTVRITDELVKRVCEPVQLRQYGQVHDEVASALGCTSKCLDPLRRNGRFRVRSIARLRGRPGRPVPILSNDEILDPAAREKRGPDEVLGADWLWAASYMPSGFSQTVTRVPRHHRQAGRERFHGWDWICPCCRRAVHNLYYPQPHPDLAIWLGWARAVGAWQQQHCPIFACRACHKVLSFHRTCLEDHWNHLVLHHSGGLLYGHEVKKPAWLTPCQARGYSPRAESPRRLAIKRLLVTTTLSLSQIARRFHITTSGVGMSAISIYKREGVGNRDGLRDKLAHTYPRPEQAGRCAG